MADAAALKAAGPQGPCGFESRPGQLVATTPVSSRRARFGRFESCHSQGMRKNVAGHYNRDLVTDGTVFTVGSGVRLIGGRPSKISRWFSPLTAIRLPSGLYWAKFARWFDNWLDNVDDGRPSSRSSSRPVATSQSLGERLRPHAISVRPSGLNSSTSQRPFPASHSRSATPPSRSEIFMP